MPVENTEAKDRVLVAAERLFMAKGYQAVSMRDIAQELGVRQSSLYYHAPQGKEQLFYEAVVRNLHRHQQAIDDIVDQTVGFREQFHAIARWFVQSREMDMMRLLRMDVPEMSDHYRTLLFNALYESLMQPLVRIIQAGQAQGQVKMIKPEVLAGGLISIVSWTSYLNATSSVAVTSLTETEQMIDVLLDGCWVNEG